jgi:poly-gamma-glutamate capsule biosynthesis protein CapA/YwtB (metallophosphatase superfamily)
MRIALAGDVMLGRLVDQEVIRLRSLPPATVWGDVLPVLLAADLRVINLECVIGHRGQPWRPDTKAFHFRAHPRAVEVLRAARIDCVALANNHVLDYGPDALAECLRLLSRAGIRSAGAGAGTDEAVKPALLDVPEGRVAIVALTDNEPDWEATETKTGVNYVAYDANGLVEPYRARIAAAIAYARTFADLVIVGAHVGPNWGPPSAAMRSVARHLMDLGADLYWGHSNHTPQGIEVYRGRPILYSAGDFVDDYAVDPEERNDLSFLFVVEADPPGLRRLRLHPVAIEDCRVRLARGTEVEFLHGTMRERCAALGTDLRFEGSEGTILL